jgi:hypothetical protein
MTGKEETNLKFKFDAIFIRITTKIKIRNPFKIQI